MRRYLDAGTNYYHLVWTQGWEISISLQDRTDGVHLALIHIGTGGGSSDVAVDNIIVRGGTCGSGKGCICSADSRYAEAGDDIDNADGAIFMAEAAGSMAPGYPDNIELTCAHCLVQNTAGAVYSHWGNSTCPEGHRTMYTGYVVGSHSSSAGGGADYLCMSSRIGLNQYDIINQAPTADVYRAEYHYSNDGPLSSLSDLSNFDAVCSVCQAPGRPWSLTVPGRHDCPDDFELDYSGYLMSETYNAGGRMKYICVDNNTVGVFGSAADAQSAGLYATETGDGFGSAGGYVDHKEVSCAQCSTSSGPVYVRWGRSSCPASADLVYSGLVAGSEYRHTGGGYNYLCMHEQAAYGTDGNTDEDAAGARLYRAEYDVSTGGLYYFWVLQDEDVPCAVCQSSASVAVFMTAGTTQCPAGWGTEYSGYLMSSGKDTTRTEYICLDEQAEAATNSDDSANTNIARISPVEIVRENDDALGGHVGYMETHCKLCSRGKPAIQNAITAHFTGDIASLSQTADMDDFVEAKQVLLGAAIGISASRVDITSVDGGSIVVEFSLLAGTADEPTIKEALGKHPKLPDTDVVPKSNRAVLATYV
eukprot:SAG11_NODE_1474_length_4839_cov_2.761603_2_plen_590_part_00